MKFVVTLATVFLFTSSAFALNLSNEEPVSSSEITDLTKNKCGGNMTQEALFQIARDRKLTVFTLTPSGSKKLVNLINGEFKKINAKRPDSEQIALIAEHSQFYYTPIEINTTGVVFVTDGCVEEGTMQREDSARVSELMSRAGVTLKEMISTPVDLSIKE